METFKIEVEFTNETATDKPADKPAEKKRGFFKW